MEALNLQKYLAWRATHPRIAGGDNMNLEELRARQDAIRTRLQGIHSEFNGQALPEQIRNEWNELNEEREQNKILVRELEAREERVRSIVNEDGGGNENGGGSTAPGASFGTSAPRGRSSDVWDYTHVRSASSPEVQRSMLRDQAQRALERVQIPNPEADEARCKAHVERLLLRDDPQGTLALRMLNTGNPLYQRAFGKTIIGQAVSPEEQRALGLTNSAGGYAVPFTLDPTIIPTSNYSVNPYRAIARVETITGTTWQGVTSAGVTATRRAEAAEMADNAPTLGQPTVTPQRVDVFIPFSMEIGQDWQGMQGEMAKLISDAKDDEEAASFTTGSGTAPAAQGITVGATTVVTAGGTAAFAVADLYALEQAVPPRFRPRASLVANRFVYNKVRQFDTAGGASIWVDNLQLGVANNASGTLGQRVLGYPAYEASTMSSALTTGQLIAVMGDFSYFLIVDRIGMDVELVPHLFGSTNLRPTGQRGLFAFWRNNSKVLDVNAFRTLKTG